MKRVFLLFLLFPCAGSALTLNEAVHLYLDQSAQLKAQSHLADLTRGDRWRRFFPREPQFQLTNGDDSSSYSYGLSLTTSFPGKSIAFNQADRARAASEESELRARRLDLARLVSGAYMECASSQATVALQEDAVEDFEALAKTLQTLYEAGHSTQAEKIGAQLQARQIAADLDQTRAKSAGACRKWREVMASTKASEKLDALPTEMPDDLDASVIQDLGAETADQARANALSRVATASRNLRWWSQAPDLTWSVARNHYSYSPASPAGRDWTTTFSVGISLPLFFLFNESVEARRQSEQATLDQTAAEIQLATAVSDREAASREFGRAQRRLRELREKDIPLAEALVDSTLAAYKSGRLGYSELILSRRTLVDLKTQDIQLRGAAIDARLRCLNDCQTSDNSSAPNSKGPQS